MKTQILNTDPLARIPEDGEMCWFEPRSLDDMFRRSRTDGSDLENRTTWMINTPQEDGHRTIIPAESLDLSDYAKNPIVLLGHWSDDLAGRSKVSLRDKNGTKVLEANMKDGDVKDGGDWDLEDEEVMRNYRKVQKGLLRGASIGFQAISWKREPRDPNKEMSWDNMKMTLVKGILKEWSLVSLPSNPGALVTSRMLYTPSRSIVVPEMPFEKNILPRQDAPVESVQTESVPLTPTPVAENRTEEVAAVETAPVESSEARQENLVQPSPLISVTPEMIAEIMRQREATITEYALKLLGRT